MSIDINLQIIQLVQSRPILFTKSNNFRGRTLHWKQVANILKTEIPWVKSRWHILRSKFLSSYSAQLKGKRSAFKYFDEMFFLIEHVDIGAFDLHSNQDEIRNQPEFVIEKKDLEEESDEDDSSNIFVELEMEESQNKEMMQVHEGYEITEEISEDGYDNTTVYIPNVEFPDNHQPPQANTAECESSKEVEVFQIISGKEPLTVDEEDKTKDNVEESMPKMDTNSCEFENSDSAKEEQQPIAENPKSTEIPKPQEENHRCEDAIFGELVAATLRRMESDKKKSVKREIMNILFT